MATTLKRAASAAQTAGARGRDSWWRPARPATSKAEVEAALINPAAPSSKAERRVMAPNHGKEAGGDGTHSIGVGTPSYAAPEQLRPGASVSAACDIFPLALLGYELFHCFGSAMERAKIFGDLRRLDGKCAAAALPAWCSA